MTGRRQFLFGAAASVLGCAVKAETGARTAAGAEATCDNFDR